MFIDAHLHTARRKGLPRNAAGENFATPEELIGMMDRTGVERGILLPSSSPECSYQQVTSEDVIEVCETYPNRFHPFCNVDPRDGSNSPDADLSFHLNYYKGRGCLGVGEITANLEFGDPLVQNLFRHCERCELPVLFHVAPKRFACYGLIDTVGMAGLDASLAAFPKLVFIGHSQPFWAEISGDVTTENRNTYPKGPIVPGGALPRLMNTYPNLYCGWDAASGYNGLTRDPEYGWSFMERFSDRILFGTDICDPSNNHQHAEYLRTSHADGRISDASFENISWRTANQLFGLGL
ncbi:MAG: amidohydrolase family protein [Verrucomicrobia bacterium]|nr:amidohydrolase family protein [Verrucomicrobiota bacterium]MBU4246788.1 amidohydrolase family protein [Verrucomicrobiota bacterium]MBU4290578.1 amidohydrolase family protein [Verrucomicrobiota bacterium]MBU4496602.1 amidohydrolase family protein [Verrucomicrobiota bacterium]MCG2681206.1 amidohydrolase family protein [Kiritimatiellia bacterium]